MAFTENAMQVLSADLTSIIRLALSGILSLLEICFTSQDAAQMTVQPETPQHLDLL